jgi:hypothetical protein
MCAHCSKNLTFNLQLDIACTLQTFGVLEDDTIHAHFLVLGGSKLSAAERARLEHERNERKRISDENYARWFDCADQTRVGDGVMRLVISRDPATSILILTPRSRASCALATPSSRTSTQSMARAGAVRIQASLKAMQSPPSAQSLGPRHTATTTAAQVPPLHSDAAHIAPFCPALARPASQELPPPFKRAPRRRGSASCRGRTSRL